MSQYMIEIYPEMIKLWITEHTPGRLKNVLPKTITMLFFEEHRIHGSRMEGGYSSGPDVSYSCFVCHRKIDPPFSPHDRVEALNQHTKFCNEIGALSSRTIEKLINEGSPLIPNLIESHPVDVYRVLQKMRICNE